MGTDPSRHLFSYLDHLECPRCGARLDADLVQGICQCGSPLWASYDLDAVRRHLPLSELAARGHDLWRYHELLPVRSPLSVVTLGEGMSPLLSLDRMGRSLGLERLLMKDEGVLPTGTFKARGAAVGVSRAAELGVRRIAMPTNGNAGAAWACYAARAGLEALIVMPRDAPTLPRLECTIAGARLYLVEGLINDAGVIVQEAVASQGYMDASTLREPYRLEGKKTMGLEIFEQLGWKAPEVILYPTGGGVGLIGIWKAWQECQQLGWIGPKAPKLVAVQASGCAPIVRAFEQQAEVSEPWQNASTIAFGITVPKPLGDFLVLRAIRSTGGCAVAVSDAEIVAAQATLARLEGTFVCPEAAACLAAVDRLRRSGWLAASDQTVVLNTGTGLLYPDSASIHPRLLSPADRLPAG